MKKQFFGVLCAFVLFTSAFLLQPISHRTEMVLPEIVKAAIGDDDDPNARLRHEWMMLRDPATGSIPRDIRQKEMELARELPTREQVRSLGKPGDVNVLTWVSRGPWNVGGRTRALGVDVNNPSIILAGGISGGLWRSADDGATWSKSTAPGALHSATCLAQDTRSGQTNTWYYGTGELLGNSAGGGGGASYTGDGIFKSTNNGTSWALLASTSTGQPHRFDNFFDYVWNVAVHPTTGHVYAATFGTIQRSTDGGQSWAIVLGGAQPFSSLTDVQIGTDGTIYATGSGDGSTMAGIYKSSTGAAGSWQNITPNDMTNTVQRIVVGISRSNPNRAYFLAETPQSGTNNHSIWVYNAQTTSYVNQSANMPAFGGEVGNFDSQRSYDLVISVKPDNENVVIIGGTNLYRSTDGFATSANTTWIGGYSTANDISVYANHHPDCHSLVWSPTNTAVLYSGHDGGVSKSSNVLATPHVWQQLSRGYLTTQFYTVALDHGSTSNDVIGGLQDNGCWGTNSAAGNATWTELFGGDGAFTAIANGGAWRVVSSQNGNTFRQFGTNQLARVDPQGGTGYLFINPFILDPNNSNIMYFAGGNLVWRNSDVTQLPAGPPYAPPTLNWTQLQNSSVTGQTQVSALAVSQANPANRLYIGHSIGRIVKVDGANTGDPQGVDITPPAVQQGSYVSRIAVDPTDGNKILVAYSNYGIVSLYSSVNGGTAWTDVEGNLAGTVVQGSSNGPSCRTVAIVPFGGTTTFYVGTSVGLFSTTTLNGTSTVWAQEGATNIGNVVVQFLDSRTTDGRIIAGTHANGAFSSGGGGGTGTRTVYSGDANNDNACDVRDILPIGRFFGVTGPARTGGSTWTPQTVSVWNPEEATYADCNGNGTVEATDVQAIITNYGLQHAANDRPNYNPLDVCNELLRSIDAQPSSPAMREIRNAVVAYMKNTLGVSFDFALQQNWPNPFNPSTTIRFTVPAVTPSARIEIYNTAGQRVWEKSFTDVQPGTREVVWAGETSKGTHAASGVYIYTLAAGQYTAAKRMLLIK